MADIPIGIGTKLLVLVGKGGSKMLKKVAAKYAPFEFQSVDIAFQPHPVITFNQKESICELRIVMNFSNFTLYDLKLLFCQIDLEINGSGLTRLESAKMLVLPRVKSDTLILSKPLTEFEYKRALNLFGQQQIQKCQEGAPPQRGKRRPPAPGSEALRAVERAGGMEACQGCLVSSARPAAPFRAAPDGDGSHSS